MISSKSFISPPYVLFGIVGGALLLIGAALALAIGMHRKKQRKQYECLPYSNQVSFAARYSSIPSCFPALVFITTVGAT